MDSLCELFIVKSTEIENRLLSNEHRDLLLEGRNVVNLDSGYVYTILNII